MYDLERPTTSAGVKALSVRKFRRNPCIDGGHLVVVNFTLIEEKYLI